MGRLLIFSTYIFIIKPQCMQKYLLSYIYMQLHNPVSFYRSQLTNGSLYISSVIEDQGLTGSYQCRAALPNGWSIVSRKAAVTLASTYSQYKNHQPVLIIIIFRSFGIRRRTERHHSISGTESILRMSCPSNPASTRPMAQR